MNKFLLIALFCILGAALVKSAINNIEVIKEFMKFSKQCMIEEGGTQADFNALLKQEPAPSREAKCMRACLLKKYKLVDENDKYDYAAAVKHAQYLSGGDAKKLKIAYEIIEFCSPFAVRSTDRCEAGELFGNCLREQKKLHGLNKLIY